MARRVVSRKAKREEAEAAAELEKSAVKKKKATKRKSRAKAAADERKKLFWGVFSQSLKQVAIFEFNEKDKADKRAEDLSKNKGPHFVQKVKKPVEEP